MVTAASLQVLARDSLDPARIWPEVRVKPPDDSAAAPLARAARSRGEPAVNSVEYRPRGGQAQVTEDRLKGLMLRGLEGDAAAHRMLLSNLAELLSAFFKRRVINAPFDADDLVQETLIAVHNRRMSYDPSRPFMAWAFAIARYKLADAYRRYNARVTEPLEAAVDVSAEDESEGASARMDLERLIGELPAKQREAIRYTKIQGLSVAEAAERSGLSESFVKVSVHRGLKRLMNMVQKGPRDAV
jgi:RNA polymerase sigma factor (sigma-70 family)